MPKRYIWLLLALLLALPAASPLQAEAPSTLAATFAVQPLQLEGFTQQENALYLDVPQGALLSQIYEPGWEFIALAVTWENALPEGSEPVLAVRVSQDGQQWGEWHPLGIAEDERPAHGVAAFSELLFVQGRYAQLRATLANPKGHSLAWQGLRLTLIDGRPGPEVALAQPSATTNEPHIISRQAWGANESYRFGGGEELWPREYATARALFVHHTATAPSSPDPSAAVRSIYYYHAVTLGWGDIGYHFLVDQVGNIYQGRYGTEWDGKVVVGGHALGYNVGTLGVSMIGNYSSSSPSNAAMASLKELLAWRAARYGINPQQAVWLAGQGSHPDRWFSHALMGHRDSHDPARTSCPGDALYARLPEIRSEVAARLSTLMPTLQLVEPGAGSILSGPLTFQANASPNVVRVSYYLDNSLLGSSNEPPWQLAVDAASLPAGVFTLRATGHTVFGLQASEERVVQVAEVNHASRLANGPRATLSPTITPLPLVTPTPTTIADRPTPRPGTTTRLYLPLMQWGRAPTPTPTPSPTATPRPTSQCQEQVSNGAFYNNRDWSMLLGQYAARYVTEQSWSAPRSLRVGMAPGDNYESFSSARYPLTLPTNALTATLTLRYLPQHDGVADEDRHYLGILNEAGSYVASVVPSGQHHSTEWQSASYDLAPFLGQSIYLYVGAKNDGAGGSTRLYVDDVQVTVCTPP